MKKMIISFAMLPFLTSCAVLHHIQVSDVDGRITSKGKRFEIRLSETGVNLKKASRIAKSLTSHKETKDQIGQAQKIISMFQMGPRTGNMIFNEDFANNLVFAIKAKCPRGRVTSLMSVREMRKYPVVSGEIVKIVGYCMPEEKI